MVGVGVMVGVGLAVTVVGVAVIVMVGVTTGVIAGVIVWVGRGKEDVGEVEEGVIVVLTLPERVFDFGKISIPKPTKPAAKTRRNRKIIFSAITLLYPRQKIS